MSVLLGLNNRFAEGSCALIYFKIRKVQKLDIEFCSLTLWETLEGPLSNLLGRAYWHCFQSVQWTKNEAAVSGCSGFPVCRNLWIWVSLTATRGQGPEERAASPRKEVLYYPRKHGNQNPVLSSWEQLTAGWVGFEGRTSEMFCPRKGMCECSKL